MSDGIPQEHKDLLKSNPEKYRAEFDKTYGSGAADNVLQQMDSIEQEDASKRGVVSDVVLQAVGGVGQAAQEVLDLGAKVTDVARKAGVPIPAYDFTQGKLLSSEEVLKERENRKLHGRDDSFIDIPDIDDPHTIAGGLTRGVIQFASGFWGAGKFTRLNKLKYLKNKPYTKAYTKGVIADVAVFDEHEARFSDFINEYAPVLATPVSEYLAADPEDGFAEGRLKNALEGLMLGGAVETIFKITRATKKAIQARLKGKDPNKVFEKETKGLEKDIKKVEEQLDDPKGLTKEENIITRKTVKGKKVEIDTEFKTVRLKKKTSVDTDKLAKDLVDEEVIGQLTKNLARAKKGEMSYDEALDIPFNINKITKDQDSQIVLATLTKAIRDKAPEVFEGKESWTRVLKLADQLLENPVDLMRKMATLAKEMEGGASKVAATGIMLENLTKLFPQAARHAMLTGNKEKLRVLQELTTKYMVDLKVVKKGGARITAVGRLETAGKRAKKLKYLQDEFIITGNEQKYLRKLANLDADPHILLRVWRKVLQSASWDVPNFYWINAILSSPKTHMVNVTSNFMLMAMRPLEQMLGATARIDKQSFFEGLETLGGLHRYFWDSLKLASKSFYRNEGILDPQMYKVETPTVKGQNIVTKGVSNVVGLPTRFLNAEDAFFKVINYKSKLQAMALRDARVKGFKAGSDEFSEHVADYMEKGIHKETGEATNEAALQYARENTFTQDLEKGFGADMQRAIQNNPMLRQFVPFLRTPLNILRAVWQRTPVLGAFQFQLRRDMFENPDPAIRAAAWGKQIMGSILVYTGYELAKRGKITGGGSKNRQNKLAQLRTGYLPFSLRVGDKYYSFGRLEPYGMMLGILAEIAEISEDVDEKTLNELALGANLYAQHMLETNSSTLGEKIGRGIIATTKNLTSKSYFKGMSDILEVINSDEEWKWKRLWHIKVSSFVPNILRAANNDPYYREIRSTLDSVKASLPYWSETLEPKYNFLGKPDERQKNLWQRMFSPIQVSEEKKDPLLEEIANNLNIGIAPAADKIGNVKLFNFKQADEKGNVIKNGKNAYQRLNELIAQEDLEGALRDLISETDYETASDSFGTNDLNYKGSKLMLMEKIIRQYRELAKGLLRDEDFVSESGLTLTDALDNDRQNKILTKNDELSELLRVD